MSAPAKAVFLSYASQDAQAARRICDSLRKAGIEVWFDQSELRGGEAWDASIRRKIKECALFLPVMSASTQSRSEGYFRLEWKLAVDRSHLMAEDQAFLLPVVIDPALDLHARVPEKFREVQWTQLPAGETTAEFVERVRRLLSESAESGTHHALPSAPPLPAAPDGEGTSWQRASRLLSGRGAQLALGLLAVVAASASALHFVGRSNAPETSASPVAAPAGFSPPPHSVAVLPFVNMSGDPKQDYFSDGLSEELLNSLVAIPDLQVAARTSSFSFKGKDTKLADIGRELNVGAVLEGSVRKDGNQVRITAQLINAVTGYHLWSQTYDRELKGVLALQSEIAAAVTRALQASLLSSAATAIEIGGTKTPAAFDAYLRGRSLDRLSRKKENVLAAADAFAEAIRLDPAYAKAYVGLADEQTGFASNFASDADEMHGWSRKARESAEKAVALAPELGTAHGALANILVRGYLDFVHARAELDRALALSPNDADVLQLAGGFVSLSGHQEEALANMQRATALDPLNPRMYSRLAFEFFWTGKYRESIETYERVLQIAPADPTALSGRGLAQLQLGDLDAASASCLPADKFWAGELCLAILYDKQRQRGKAEAQLATMRTELGDTAAYQYAEIYSQWGDIPKALQWLDVAYRLPDPGILGIREDIWISPLRKEPRFQEIVRKLNFPS